MSHSKPPQPRSLKACPISKCLSTCVRHGTGSLVDSSMAPGRSRIPESKRASHCYYTKTSTQPIDLCVGHEALILSLFLKV